MQGPKVSKQSNAQIITVPLPAGLLPTAHFSHSAQINGIHAPPMHMMQNLFIRPSHFRSLLLWPISMLSVGTFDGGQGSA